MQLMNCTVRGLHRKFSRTMLAFGIVVALAFLVNGQDQVEIAEVCTASDHFTLRDCLEDEKLPTVKITQDIDLLEYDSKIIGCAKGSICIDRPVTLIAENQKDITGNCDGGCKQIIIVMSTDVTLENLILVRGASAEDETDARGIVVEHGRNVLIRCNTIRDQNLAVEILSGTQVTIGGTDKETDETTCIGSENRFRNRFTNNGIKSPSKKIDQSLFTIIKINGGAAVEISNNVFNGNFFENIVTDPRDEGVMFSIISVNALNDGVPGGHTEIKGNRFLNTRISNNTISPFSVSDTDDIERIQEGTTIAAVLMNGSGSISQLVENDSDSTVIGQEFKGIEMQDNKIGDDVEVDEKVLIKLYGQRGLIRPEISISGNELSVSAGQIAISAQDAEITMKNNSIRGLANTATGILVKDAILEFEGGNKVEGFQTGLRLESSLTGRTPLRFSGSESAPDIITGNSGNGVDVISSKAEDALDVNLSNIHISNNEVHGLNVEGGQIAVVNTAIYKNTMCGINVKSPRNVSRMTEAEEDSESQYESRDNRIVRNGFGELCTIFENELTHVLPRTPIDGIGFPPHIRANLMVDARATMDESIFNDIQSAINDALPGDVVEIVPASASRSYEENVEISNDTLQRFMQLFEESLKLILPETGKNSASLEEEDPAGCSFEDLSCFTSLTLRSTRDDQRIQLFAADTKLPAIRFGQIDDIVAEQETTDPPSLVIEKFLFGLIIDGIQVDSGSIGISVNPGHSDNVIPSLTLMNSSIFNASESGLFISGRNTKVWVSSESAINCTTVDHCHTKGGLRVSNLTNSRGVIPSVSIAESTIANASGSGVVIDNSNTISVSIEILDSFVLDNSLHGIDSTGANLVLAGTEIRRNEIHGVKLGNGLNASEHVEIFQNMISDSGCNGILVEFNRTSLATLSIKDNSIELSGRALGSNDCDVHHDGSGLRFRGRGVVEIQENTISTNMSHGILLHGLIGNNVDPARVTINNSNEITDNMYWGVALFSRLCMDEFDLPGGPLQRIKIDLIPDSASGMTIANTISGNRAAVCLDS